MTTQQPQSSEDRIAAYRRKAEAALESASRVQAPELKDAYARLSRSWGNLANKVECEALPGAANLTGPGLDPPMPRDFRRA